MALSILNIGDLERALRNRAAHLHSREAQDWLKAVPKNYLRDVDGGLDETDKHENLKPFTGNGNATRWMGCPQYCLIGWRRRWTVAKMFMFTIRFNPHAGHSGN